MDETKNQPKKVDQAQIHNLYTQWCWMGFEISTCLENKGMDRYIGTQI